MTICTIFQYEYDSVDPIFFLPVRTHCLQTHMKFFKKNFCRKESHFCGEESQKIECGWGKCTFDFSAISIQKGLFNFMQDLRRKQEWVNKTFMYFLIGFLHYMLHFSLFTFPELIHFRDTHVDTALIE